MIIEQCKIIRNEQIAGGIWEMEFHAPEIASHYSGPGQFLEILLDNRWSFPVRRPMSIAEVAGNNMKIIYKIFGRGTQLLSGNKSGDSLDILGPLGNVFTNWNNSHYPILVGGGVGLAPILNLNKKLNENSIQSTVIIGAKSENEHFLVHDPDNQIYLTTDDGSIGIKGTVLPTLEKVLTEAKNPIIYACGPLPMLKGIQDFVYQKSISAQLSVESYMGCGTGLCQGCVIERQRFKEKDHSYHERYSLVCMDGPVYSADEVKFD